MIHPGPGTEDNRYTGAVCETSASNAIAAALSGTRKRYIADYAMGDEFYGRG